MELRRLEENVAESRIVRVARRPHEVRVHLLRATDPSVWLRFAPAEDATVDLLMPDATVTAVTADKVDGRVWVRFWSADQVALEAVAREWSWHPYDRDDGIWGLAEDEKTAVRRAVEVVVAHDADALVAMLPADWTGPAEDFWMWADDYRGDGVPIRLLLPPQPFDDWEGSVIRAPAQTFVEIDFLNADNPAKHTDLTLELSLTRKPDGALQVEVQNLHVM